LHKFINYKRIFLGIQNVVGLESFLENARFLKAVIIDSLLKEEKNEEILVSFTFTGADHGFPCVSLRG
jgi:hypothetical protein